MPIRFKQAHRGNYSPGRAYPVEYIVVHYTANSGDTAQNNLDYFARKKTGTSAHYFVDENEVCQSVSDTDTAYHCGSSNPVHPYCRNANSIGVEMCDSVNGVPEATKIRTANFVRELMARYGVPVENVLRHYDVTGKRCPAPWVVDPAEWDNFKAMLKEDEGMMTQEQFNKMADTYFEAKANEKPGDWSKSYRAWAEENGLITGDNSGHKRYKSPITREELVTVLYSFCNYLKSYFKDS